MAIRPPGEIGTAGDAADWSWGRDGAAELEAVVLGLRRRFPQGDDPFQIMTCLLQEGGAHL